MVAYKLSHTILPICLDTNNDTSYTRLKNVLIGS